MDKSWELSCFPDIFSQKQVTLKGDQIILPASILEELTNDDDDIQSPYIFTITTGNTEQVISCYAIEFTNYEPVVNIPNWINHNLYPYQVGDMVKISLLNLEI